MHPNMINPKKYRQLFLDDFAVESMKSITRTLHSPKKWGTRHQWGGGSESILPAMEFGEETVGMVVLRRTFVLRDLRRR